MNHPTRADRPTPAPTRRRFLAGTAAALAAPVGLAGCIEGPGGSTVREDEGYGAFFTLADWGNQVGGDHFTFDQPVEAGQVGHGWDPDFDILAEAATRRVFVYLDSPEFAWAQDVAGTLETDHPDVTTLDAMRAIPASALLGFEATRPAARDPDPPAAFDPETFSVGRFDVIDPRTGETVAWWHDSHWHGGLPSVPEGASLELSVHVEDDEGRVPPLGEDGPFRLEARVADGAPTDIVSSAIEGATIHLTGVETGQTLVVFELRTDDEVVFTTESDAAVVTVESPEEIEIDVFHDPHVWVDPVLAIDIVEELAATLAEIDPEHADAFETNAAAYIDDLDAVDDRIRSIVADAETTDVVFAGHHSFGYVAHRYGIDFHTPVGVSPDAEVTLSDVSGLARVITDVGLDTVLYDPFEAPDPDRELPPMVEVLLEETDAEEAMPLSAAEGITAAWRDQDFGYLEQWTEINLPALEAALGTGQS